ncbi:hypothetical protein Hanom_Chr16g01426321 [Helianthus anomalus]
MMVFLKAPTILIPLYLIPTSFFTLSLYIYIYIYIYIYYCIERDRGERCENINSTY